MRAPWWFGPNTRKIILEQILGPIGAVMLAVVVLGSGVTGWYYLAAWIIGLFGQNAADAGNVIMCMLIMALGGWIAGGVIFGLGQTLRPGLIKDKQAMLERLQVEKRVEQTAGQVSIAGEGDAAGALSEPTAEI